MNSKSLIIAASIVGASLMVPLCAVAQTTSPAASSVDSNASTAPGASVAPANSIAVIGPAVTVQVVSAAGTVTSIDRINRLVAMKGHDGRMVSLLVGPNIRNFENLKVGDEVTVRFTEAYALAIAKGEKDDESKIGELRTKVEAESAKQAAPGGKPGLATMEQTTMVANVFEIDRERGILTLRGTDGVPVDIKVPDRQALSQINPNDQVVIGYRRGSVVAIEPGGSSGGAIPASAR